MRSVSSSAKRTNGSSASRTSAGSASSTFFGKLGLEHLGSLAPMLFTNPRVALISCVRTCTKVSRARSTTRSCRTSVLRCSIGNNDCGSTRSQSRQLVGIDPVIFALATLRRLHQSRVGDQHLVPATYHDFPHPGRVCPHFENHARGR